MSTKFIFFGNGPLAEATLNQLLTAKNLELVFHAKTKEDLVEVARLMQENPEIKGILASFGVLIKSDLLELLNPKVFSISTPLSFLFTVVPHQLNLRF